MPFRVVIAFVVCLSLLVLPGCIGLMPSPFRPSPGPQKAPQAEDLAQAFDIVCRNYRLGPDDSLGVLYQAEWNIASGTYKLDTLDRIRVKFLFDPELNEEVTIAPDGIITLQGVGEIQAAGLTRQQLAARIEQRLLEGKIFKSDKLEGGAGYRLVTVHLVEFYGKVNRLVDSLRTLTGGTQTAVTVKPDGTIDLPLLKERIFCTGHTISELEDTVNRLYRSSVVNHVVVSLSLSKANSRKIYILGQVGSPGAYNITQPVTALQALALAGGAVENLADLTSVILISQDISGKPIGRRLDLKRILDVGDMGSAILMKPYDVMYVPRTYIADVGIFMEQYVGVVSGINALVQSLRPTSTQISVP